MSRALLPVRAQGLLRDFAEAGVLAAADVHVALRLSRLGEESSEPVLLAVALTVRSLRLGSVCLELSAARDVALDSGDEDTPPPDELPWPEPGAWLAALRGSPLVACGVDAAWRPLRLVDGLLYLDRSWQQEQLVRRELDERAARPVPAVELGGLDALFPDAGPDGQRLAVALAASRWVTVVTGGPGTGKTHTVARLLRLLHEQPGPPPRVALAAPTGKAAARLQEAVQGQAAGLGLPGDLTASTLHRLLGWRPDSRTRFRHDRDTRLPHDVVVVDEASMVPLAMMARLLDAVRPTARLVLVGDADQLTPVGAGAVLSDLVHRPPAAGAVSGLPAALVPSGLDAEQERQLRGGVVRLTVSHRYGRQIGDLAEAVRTGDADRAVALLQAGTDVVLTEEIGALRAEVVEVAAALSAAARAGDAVAALALLGRHRLLCAHRTGPYGVAHWNEQVSRWTGTPTGLVWHAGQPLLVTANDRDTGLWNGDAGVVVATPDGLRAAFPRPGGPELLSPSRLSAVQPAHALTVHRSQGSQYDAVSVLLPPPASPLLSRELLYTALTRASRTVRLVGTEEAVRAAVGRHVVRASGLRRAVGPVVQSGG